MYCFLSGAVSLRNELHIKSLLLFMILTGCATSPAPISSQKLEGDGDWSVTEVAYTNADIKDFPVYSLLANEQEDSAVDNAVAWCEGQRTPCCYQTQSSGVATCYQLVGKAKAAMALGKWLRKLLKRKEKDPLENPPPPKAPSAPSSRATAPETTVIKRPAPGVGGNGIASEFGSLQGMSRTEADAFLQTLGSDVKTTAGGYKHYRLPDKSEVVIRPDGEVIRLPKPIYDTTGKRINKGVRLDETGSPTSSHNTGERVVD